MARRSARPRQRAFAAAPAVPGDCPCGLSATYEACCGRYHAGAGVAATAEALMRSRYSAFVTGEAGYLLRTWHPRTRPERLELDPGMRWTGLQILSVADGSAFHPTGTVEFRASYRGGSLHERSRFERVDGAWAYVDGDFPE
ncbi:YchJ family protein [Streptomyces sp. NPDC054884]|uniref:YchJ family protein n=1 Tax=Streptomyces sp. ME08-AFT2 TaxID=3028683 RepID=UPI0029ABAED9|nr:YchJ family metal-binding protein [Streptomyces sp. ME08-AFT2]MDX3309473.1 YchJ family metal-binding protein [Streptomyces sp. ME08-AFT2]